MKENVFNYSELKNNKNFPKETNIISILDGKVNYEIIFKKDDTFYKIKDISIDIDKYNDFDYFFEIVKSGQVIAYEVKQVKKTVYEWKLINEDFEEKVDLINKELSKLSLSELGLIVNSYGKKYNGQTVDYIFNKDIDFIEWLKDNPPIYNMSNEYILEKEKSRLALINYYEAKMFLKAQGK